MNTMIEMLFRNLRPSRSEHQIELTNWLSFDLESSVLWFLAHNNLTSMKSSYCVCVCVLAHPPQSVLYARTSHSLHWMCNSNGFRFIYRMRIKNVTIFSLSNRNNRCPSQFWIRFKLHRHLQWIFPVYQSTSYRRWSDSYIEFHVFFSYF